MNNFFAQNRNIILVALGVFMVSMTVLLFFLNNGEHFNSGELKTSVVEELSPSAETEDVAAPQDDPGSATQEEDLSGEEDVPVDDEIINNEDETPAPVIKNTTPAKKPAGIKKEVIYQDVNVDEKSQDNAMTVWKKKKVNSNNGFTNNVEKTNLEKGIDPATVKVDKPNAPTGTYYKNVDKTKGKWIMSYIPTFNLDYLLLESLEIGSI